MRNLNLNEVEEQKEYSRITTGGYVCKIISVEDVPEKEYLKIEYDIAEGEFRGYYKELFDSKGFWSGKFIKSYKEKALPFFKAFITAVENSNKGYQWDNNETKLVGKLVGLVIGEEEYTKNDGTVGGRLYVDKPRSVEAIKKGDYEVPKFKYLSNNKPTTNNIFGFVPADENENDPDDFLF